MYKYISRFVAVSFLASVIGATAAEQVTISEFMASNTRTYQDEDHQYGDWIELRNSGTNAVNLDGWYLTDSMVNLTKWRMPATNIAAGAFIVVFADGKDRKVPGATLHANFSLSAGGEYLALVKPDGVSIATQFSPVYPGQAPDVSYGFGVLASNFTVITTNADVRVQIPSSGVDGTNWAYLGYDDSSWIAGTNGVGYGATNAFTADYAFAISPTLPIIHYRLDETTGTTATNIGSGGTALNGTYNGAIMGTTGPRPPGFNGFEAGNNAPTFNGSSAYVAGPVGFFNNLGAFSVGGWVRPTATPAARTGLFGQNDCVEFGFISGTTLECWTPSGGSVTGVPYPYPLNEWHHVFAVADGTNIRIFLDGVQAASGGSASGNYGSSTYGFNIGGGGVQDATGNFFPGQIDEVLAYRRALSAAEVLSLFKAGTNGAGVTAASFVRTDLGLAMSNVNSSAYVRIPFNIPDPLIISGLTLRMRHDDGFVAYLNGSEILRVNAVDPLAFNSSATNTHSPAVLDQFTFGPSLLQTGANILAVQGLNRATNDEDFLILAELITTTTTAESPAPVYFNVPTPGVANGSGVANPGPAFINPGHTPSVPLDAQDLVVTTKVVATFYPIGSVVMHYRIMFGSEIETPMYDDGTHGDATPGDGVFSATISESLSTNGQMIRWYFRATDILGNVSRWPLFASATESAEYLGTMVDATDVTSKLPIFHLFAAPNVLQTPRITPATTQTGADGEGGGRISIFYDGEFYDNVYMELRGNTSAGQNKKSHRMEFNPEHLFRHLSGYPRVRKTSLMAEFLDPSYLRQHLSFWLLEQMGVPAPYFYPVRAQLNGAFYGLVYHNDVIDTEQVGRLGYDPAGALYKAAGNCLPSESSTGVFQKKAPLPLSDHTDYQNFVRAINETNTVAGRRAAAFDTMDIPEMISYLACARWTAENDDVWANMSLYRDTFGDQLWRIIPFDMNASWGQRYGGITPLDAIADTCKSHPTYGGSTIIACDGSTYNRVYDTIFALPELRQMMLRRQRTILDRWVMEPVADPQSRLLETHIRQMTNMIWTEAFLDRASWGYSTWTASNKPLTNAVNELFNEFINLRRTHWSVTHNITNVAKPVGMTSASNAGIPTSQPANLILPIASMEANPSSGNQAQEYIAITNPYPIAVEISNWQLDGAVKFTFKAGTVVPSNSVIYVSPHVPSFRARATGPRGGQGLFVVGPYKGQLDARGEIVSLLDDTGRLVHTNGYVGNPSLAQQYLRITEIMYHPGPTNAGSPYPQEEFEYLELKNIGPVNLNLDGVHFTNGIDFAFSPGSSVTNLTPGQVVVLVKNAAAFTLRYGGSATIAGVYSNSLDNSGERISLHDAVGEQVLDFSYNNSWYPISDGLGFSLVIVNENAPWDTWDQKASWRPSGSLNGSAGQNDPGAYANYGVLVNEVLANSDAPAVDALELWNPTTNTVTIGGWWVSDDFYTPKKYQVPNGTMMSPGSYLALTENEFNPGGVGFSFSSGGDEAYIFAADGGGNLTGYYHGFHFDASEPGVSFGRYLTSDGDEHFVAQSALTLTNANAAPKVGPILISEIMYHPPDVAGVDDTDNEFIELHNIGTNDMFLQDPAYPTNCWRLDGAVHYKFTTNDITAGGFLLVVSFDPATNAAALDAFRARYGLDETVRIAGPYSGKLDNSEDEIQLKKPETSVPTNITEVLVERVHYHDSAPWSAVADGVGASLQRIVPGDFGNDVTNWTGASPNPGAAHSVGAAPVITVQPSNTTAFIGDNASFTAAISGPVRLAQWRLNGAVLSGATNVTLLLSNITLAQAGNYDLVVFNDAGSAVSSNALLSVRSPVAITLQPINQNVLPGTNVTMSCGAIGTGTIRYQWQFQGTNIPNATNSAYSFTGADLFIHHGTYRVIVTDDLTTPSSPNSTAVSSNAFIYVLVRPNFAIQPLAQTIVQGANLSVSVLATGAPPIWYRFIRQGASVATNNTGNFIYTNIVANLQIRVAATNLASGPSGQNSFSVNITVLPDADGDGIPDAWETQYGFNPTNSADGALDFDGDGMSNHDEYIAGTNPTDPLSVLKLTLTTTNTGLLQFVAQTNVSYTVQYRTNLASALWINLSNVTAQSGVRTVQVNAPNPPPTSERYYRIVTPLQP